MANLKNKRKQNIESTFYVDDSCIDCGTCYWMAPETFRRDHYQSAVYQEPSTPKDCQRAMEALISCPTNSIGNTHTPKPEFNLPKLIEDDVYHLGFHSEKSFGGTPYYIKSNGGIMIDCPRFNPKTKTSIKEFGGLKYQLLTHKDGIADTDLFHNFFKTIRCIHEGDKCSRAKNYENYFTGSKDIQLTDDLLIIPTPGHTKGSVCYLYKNKFLFTGDHLCFSTKLGQLIGFKNHCWYSNELLISSMEKLLHYEFTWILPEHGSPFHASPAQMKIELQKCIGYLKI